MTLSVDASQNGLGAVLLQDGRPIEYASRPLTSAEMNYAQIEKELLAIAIGCTRFHQYLYGRHFHMESDHKPLEAIFKKPLAQAPPRLQRFMLRLQRYDKTVAYKPGQDLQIADALSRAYLPSSGTAEIAPDDVEAQVHAVISSLPMSSAKLANFREQTRHDDVLQRLCAYMQTGWPAYKHEIPVSVRAYWTYRDDMHCVQDLIFKGERLVVPTAMRKEMLKLIH